MKGLFLGIDYESEQHIHGSKNGYTVFSEHLVEFFNDIKLNLDVVRSGDKDAMQLFNSDTTFSPEFDNFWRFFFPIIGSVDGLKVRRGFSRDSLYRLFSLANRLNVTRWRNLFDANTYDFVIFNRHEFFFLAKSIEFNFSKRVFIAHDSLYKRRKSYEDLMGCSQPLTNVEEALEESLMKAADAIVSVSSSEKKLFEAMNPKALHLLIRPKIKSPSSIKKIEGTINFFFVGVDNYVNRDTLKKAIEIFSRIDSLWDGDVYLNVIGPISKSFQDEDLPRRVKLHGWVENLDRIVEEQDILLAPIDQGSGVPIKIADALSQGKVVFTSKLAIDPFKEFENRCVFDMSNSSLNSDSTLKEFLDCTFRSLRQNLFERYTAYEEYQGAQLENLKNLREFLVGK